MELFGFDYVVDRQLKPWLLEVNRRPNVQPRNEAERPLREALLRATFAVGGVQGFGPTNEFAEVGRWSLE